jgi:hypothetical protein
MIIMAPGGNEGHNRETIILRIVYSGTTGPENIMKIMAFGVLWGHIGGNCFCTCLWREKILTIYFSSTTGLEKLKFT